MNRCRRQCRMSRLLIRWVRFQPWILEPERLAGFRLRRMYRPSRGDDCEVDWNAPSFKRCWNLLQRHQELSIDDESVLLFMDGSQQHALGNHCGLVKECVGTQWSGSVLLTTTTVFKSVRGMNPRYLHFNIRSNRGKLSVQHNLNFLLIPFKPSLGSRFKNNLGTRPTRSTFKFQNSLLLLERLCFLFLIIFNGFACNFKHKLLSRVFLTLTHYFCLTECRPTSKVCSHEG